jgi:hypothetical protein
MNELQVRLTGDISALQSALTKAKSTIKSFEDTAEKSGATVAKSYTRATGVIGGLQQKIGQLRKNLESATNIQSIAKYNIRLEQTQKELARVNALGRQVSGSLGSTSRSFGGLTRSVGSANGVAIEFSRIIQDAPFGLIGIGNNIQQLTQNFASLKASSGSTGAALKASLASLISPANLLVLGISAVTAAFTAYQLGAFGSKEASNELKDAQDALNDSFKETDKLARAGFYQQTLRDLGILEITVTETGRVIRDVFSDKTAEQKLDLIAKKVRTSTKPELEALATFLKERLQTSLRGAANATTELEKAISEGDQKDYQAQLTLVNEQLKFYNDETTKAIDTTKKAFEAFSKIAEIKNDEVFRRWSEEAQVFIDKLNEIQRLDKEIEIISKSIVEDDSKINPISGIQEIAVPITFDPSEKADELNNLLTKQKSLVEELSGAFTGLGALIGKAFDNTGLGQFVGEFLRFSAQLIAANFKIATANAVTAGTQSALATGPGAAIALPAFIAGAVGLVASAFAAIGGGGGGGGGGGAVASGKAPQIFTNQNNAGIPSGNSPNFNSGSIDFANSQSRLSVDVSGDSLRFILDRENERRGNG